MIKILAVASSGGHWIQLKRLTPVFVGAKVVYASTDFEHSSEQDAPFYYVPDANMWSKLKLVYMFLRVTLVVVKVRPDVVISTGAAPGFAALLIGKLMGSRTIWLDSIANVEELSRSGKMARRWADVWLTQWQQLASSDGPDYWGAVL